jgi:hypothetical protein
LTELLDEERMTYWVVKHDSLVEVEGMYMVLDK